MSVTFFVANGDHSATNILRSKILKHHPLTAVRRLPQLMTGSSRSKKRVRWPLAKAQPGRILAMIHTVICALPTCRTPQTRSITTPSDATKARPLVVRRCTNFPQAATERSFAGSGASAAVRANRDLQLCSRWTRTECCTAYCAYYSPIFHCFPILLFTTA